VIPSPLELLLAALAAALAGGVNSIAGGGTLITFPTLVAIGVPPIVANATSSVALWPGTVASMWAYRGALDGARSWAIRFAAPSLLGGAVGALLLLRTSEERFEMIVPFLVLGATGLFIVQQPLGKWLRSRRPVVPGPDPVAAVDAGRGAIPPPPAPVLVYQFLVSVYGGYFGAGMGILMLAALGLIGLRDIHQMNGLKNWGAACINLVAVAIFAASGIVDWPVGVAMAVGAMIGGYAGSGLAQRVGQTTVRRAIIVIGVASAAWLSRGQV
jgi:uncharacterized membrane protein YfcA